MGHIVNHIVRQGLQKPFAELGCREGDSPTLAADGETQAVTRRLLIDFVDLATARNQLLGYAEVGADGHLTRWLPQEDWWFAGLYANKVTRAQGLAWRDKDDQDGGSTNAFAKCVLEVEFGPRPYAVLADADIAGNEFRRFVEVESTAQGEYLSIPTVGFMKFSEGPNHNAGTPANSAAFPGNIGKVQTQIQYTFRWHQVPDEHLPEANILGAVGKVNDADFGDPDNLRLFWGAGTLLLLGAGWRRAFSPKGAAPQWVVEYSMLYDFNGHNRLLDFKADPPAWYQVTRDGVYYAPGSVPDGKCVYDEADFSLLFPH